MTRAINASLGAREQTVSLRPHGATLRQLERALLDFGIVPTVARPLGEMYISNADFSLLKEHLKGWALLVDDSLAKDIEARRQRADQIQSVKANVDFWMGRSRGDLLRILPEAERLDTHQLQAVAAIVESGIDGICVFDEQGLGKTATALWAFHYWHKQNIVDHMLVLAPKNMIFEWVNETRNLLGPSYIAQALHGSERDKRLGLKAKAHLYVTNYETAIQLEVALTNLLRRNRGRSLLVVDESFFVKNHDARRTQAVHSLRAASLKCIVLCGTPAPNSAADIIEQVNIADCGAAFHGVVLPNAGSSKSEAIQRVLSDRAVYIRRLKSEVLPELPGKDFSEVLVPMQPLQLHIYCDRLKDLIYDVRSSSDAAFQRNKTSFMARRMHLLQICSHPGALDSHYTEVPGKVVALDSLLDHYIDKSKEKVVLWSFFRYSLQNLVQRYQKYNPVYIDGSVASAKERSLAIRQFQDDNSTMLFIANPAAAGTGITLTRARIALYESFSVQAAHYLQSLDRIHRRGQTQRVSFKFLLCQNSIEEDGFRRLLQKEEAGRHLLQDDEPPTETRELFLADLISSFDKL